MTRTRGASSWSLWPPNDLVFLRAITLALCSLGATACGDRTRHTDGLVEKRWSVLIERPGAGLCSCPLRLVASQGEAFSPWDSGFLLHAVDVTQDDLARMIRGAPIRDSDGTQAAYVSTIKVERSGGGWVSAGTVDELRGRLEFLRALAARAGPIPVATPSESPEDGLSAGSGVLVCAAIGSAWAYGVPATVALIDGADALLLPVRAYSPYLQACGGSGARSLPAVRAPLLAASLRGAELEVAHGLGSVVGTVLYEGSDAMLLRRGPVRSAWTISVVVGDEPIASAAVAAGPREVVPLAIPGFLRAALAPMSTGDDVSLTFALAGSWMTEPQVGELGGSRNGVLERLGAAILEALPVGAAPPASKLEVRVSFH